MQPLFIMLFVFFSLSSLACQETIEQNRLFCKERVRELSRRLWYEKDIEERDNVTFICFKEKPLERIPPQDKSVSSIKRYADESKYKYDTTQRISIVEYPSTLCGKYIQRNIPFLQNFTSLVSLDLTNCHLQTIDLNALLLLQEVNLNQNNLKDCNGIAKLTRLIEIIIDNNNLTCVNGLKNLSKLTFFYARDNYGIDDIPPFLPNLMGCSLSGNPIEKHFRYETSIGHALVQKNGLSLLLSLLVDIKNPTLKQQELELQILKLMLKKDTYELQSLLSTITKSSQGLPEEFITLYLHALTKPREYTLNALLKKFPPYSEYDYTIMSFREKDTLFQHLRNHISSSIQEHCGSTVHDRYQELTKSLPDLYEAISQQSIHYYTKVFLPDL